jgi:YrhK-like protein
VRPDGTSASWSSRVHRKHASKLSRPGRTGVWWAPRRASWWIGVLFAIGSTCFLVGPFPGFEQLVGSGADAMVFFVGSIFFTTAAALQWLETINADPGPALRRRKLRVLTFEPRRIDWWSSGVQLVGTLFFNFTTFHALQDGLDAGAYDRLVWRPDALGSICFLVSGYLAYVEVCGHALWTRERTVEWKIAAVNLVGCIAFGISAVASFWVPSSGSVLDLAASNWFTALGGLCFLVGAVLLLPESAATESMESSGAALYAHS